VAEVADLLVWSALMRPPTLGPARLICVDGHAGSGKSTLGEELSAAASGEGAAALVHLDDLLDGWEGLADVARTLERDVLRPLADGRVGRYRRYDWHQERFGDPVDVAPVDLLVVEGVGAGATSYADLVTTLVWVDAPPALCLDRGVARDGEAMRPQWMRWREQELEVFRLERTRDRADVVVDGTGEAELAVVWK
jgi:uridine kinase